MAPEERAAEITKGWMSYEIGFSPESGLIVPAQHTTGVADKVRQAITIAIREAVAAERGHLLDMVQNVVDHPGDFEVCEGCAEGILRYLKGEWTPRAHQ